MPVTVTRPRCQLVPVRLAWPRGPGGGLESESGAGADAVGSGSHPFLAYLTCRLAIADRWCRVDDDYHMRFAEKEYVPQTVVVNNASAYNRQVWSEFRRIPKKKFPIATTAFKCLLNRIYLNSQEGHIRGMHDETVSDL